MKKSDLFIFALLILLVYGCTTENPTASLTVNVIGELPDELLYTVPVEGGTFWGFRDTVRPDAAGAFHIRISNPEPALVALFGRGLGQQGYNTFDYLLVEPGKHYEVVFDLTGDEKRFVVNDNSCKVQSFLQTLPNYGHPQEDELWHLHDSSVTVIRNTLNARKLDELARLENLYETADISNEAYQMLAHTRRLYHANVMGFVSSMKYLTPLFQGQESSDEQALELWQEATSAVSVDERFFYSAPQTFDYLNHSIWGHLYADVGFARAGEIQREYIDQGLRHTRNLNLADTYLDPSVMEYFKAAYLFFHSFQKRYEKELITLFDDFRHTYPASNYESFVSPLVGEIVQFHAKADKGFTDKMHIQDNYNDIASFEELMAPFRGKRVYLDVWSTTCGPCKREFQYVDELKELLQEEDIQMLYISIDRDSDDAQWQNMIKYYELEGYHVRAGSALRRELDKLLGIEGIPHFALVGPEGEILIPKAHRPSGMEALAEQLRETPGR